MSGTTSTGAPASGTAGGLAATTPAGAKRNPSATGLGSDFNTFLTLLTAQLKNQDPTQAMSVEQMTSQLVQFSQVEQQVKLNATMDRMVALQEAAQLTASAPLIGRPVEVASTRLALQDGAATLRLPAAGKASGATIRVLDGQGRVLREQTVALGAAPADWRWDGRDAQGRALPDGAYRFAVQGRDGAGGAVPLEATVVARATGASRDAAAGLRLRLGPGLDVGFDALRSLPGTSGG